MAKKKQNRRHEGNQGEGNIEAAHHYNEAAQKFVDDDQVHVAAKRAKEFIDESPVEAAKAEADAAAGPHPIRARVEELITEGKAIVNRAATKIAGKLRKKPVR